MDCQSPKICRALLTIVIRWTVRTVMLSVPSEHRAMAFRKATVPLSLEPPVKSLSCLFAVSLALLSLPAFGQDVLPETVPPAATAETHSTAPASRLSTAGAKQQAGAIAEKVNQDARAQEASAGILKQIYVLAEKMESPSFHWVAFGLMVAGVVSFALQLVLGKLFVLAKMSMSLTEILSDALGLAISLVGLVLTTQAAAQNSTFTTSPAAVLSATAVGTVLGFFFFRWGTAQELSAADGRKVPAKPAPVKP